ncbi:MAG: hypothetical protein H6R18_722 [Proteobacteria bacterium]|nr:hypothetical protein [Pseudomonadota bacterium]
MFRHIVQFKLLLPLLAAMILAACSGMEIRTPQHFRIQSGMSKQEVISILGPPDPTLTIAFPRRHEFSYGWTFHDIGEPYNFHVLFDAEKETVRSAMIVPFRVIVDFH